MLFITFCPIKNISIECFCVIPFDYFSKKILKCNKTEVSIILDILGICGVLSSDENPCYVVSFADMYQRDPEEHKNDFTFYRSEKQTLVSGTIGRLALTLDESKIEKEKYFCWRRCAYLLEYIYPYVLHMYL